MERQRTQVGLDQDSRRSWGVGCRWTAAGLLLGLALASLGWSASSAAAAEDAGEKKAASKRKPKVVIPFDFTSRFDKGRYGQICSELVWKRLNRQKGFVIPETIQDVRELCESNGIRIEVDTPIEKVGEAVRTTFDAQIGIWGSVERAPGFDAEVYDFTIRCVDFSSDPPQTVYEKTNVRTQSVAEIPHVYIKEMLDALYRRDPPPAAGPDGSAESRWKDGPALLPGDFQKLVNGVPEGWEPRAGQLREPLGNLVSIVPDEANAENRIVRFKFPAVVGDNEGVMYYSGEFPIHEGATYRFQVRYRTSGAMVKVFIKCYDDSETVFSAAPKEELSSKRAKSSSSIGGLPKQNERREVYRSQQNLKGKAGEWHTHTQDFTPRHTKYSPKWCRIMLYAYVGAGQVDWDDVVVKEIVPAPAQAGVKEKRLSAASKVTLKEMEANEREEAEQAKERKELEKSRKTKASGKTRDRKTPEPATE